jgi:hypothetical protein
MSLLNRDERQQLRLIQHHIHRATLNEQVVFEQLGTVDVYFHPSNPASHLNCATPHKGVAWVRREDLVGAFTGLERLGRTPRLVFLQALFPDAFRQQLELMGLTLEDQRVVMVFQPVYGPDLPGETPLGRLSSTFDERVTTSIATTRPELAAWLRLFRAGYYNTETLMIQRDEVTPLLAAVEKEESVFVIANYENTPLGAARITTEPPTAELQVVVTAPLWHDMGLEVALTATAVRAALAQDCDTIFTIASRSDMARLYRLGFADFTTMLTFWQAEDYARRVAPAASDAATESPD